MGRGNDVMGREMTSCNRSGEAPINQINVRTLIEEEGGSKDQC